MIRREFLKNAAVLASGLAAKISYGAPCPPPLDGAVNEACNQSGQSNLEVRTRGLTSGNTPQLNVNYFRSEDGDTYEIANNRTSGQGSDLTYGVQGIYYDPIRRRMHQLEREHGSTHTEHGIYDEVSNTWSQPTNPGFADGSPPGHWRQQAFDPRTGVIWWQREGTDRIYFYDPNTNAWDTTSAEPLIGEDGKINDVKGLGFHPNLFGPGKPGLLVAGFARFLAYNLTTETWHTLNSSKMSSSNPLYVCSHGEGWYFPDRDEMLMTSQSHADTVNGINTNYSIPAGAGLETDLSVATTGVEIREQPPESIAGLLGTNKCYACFHPRQPNVLLAFPADNDEVWYTADAASTPWVKAPFTHPFASELTTNGHHTVGTIPHHGVVAGAAIETANNTKFVFWRPPLV